jgi:hypothetical protein
MAREEELESAEGLARHYVGVFDARTGALQLVRAAKLVLRGSVRSAAEDDDEDAAAAAAAAASEGEGEAAPRSVITGSPLFLLYFL